MTPVWAVRMHGRMDLRLESFDLPALREDEILVRIVSDSVCMSTYKAAVQGTAHKRVPQDIAHNPVAIGHEFCGDIVKVGSAWQHQFAPGERFCIQPALNLPGSDASPGYSYPYFGGCMTYAILPREAMEQGCLLPYGGGAYFAGSLAEPLSCIIGAFRAQYHLRGYEHVPGIKPAGNMAIMGGAGPMGLAAVDYVLHADVRPSLLVVTDVDAGRLARAEKLMSPEMAAGQGVQLAYLNPREAADTEERMRKLARGAGYDDVFVFTPSAALLESADALLAQDGCLNFFAGPTDVAFEASVNFYGVHYAGHHLVGTSGGDTLDMREALRLAQAGVTHPEMMITHIGGLDAVADTVCRLPDIPGGKKLIYPPIRMPLTPIDAFGGFGESDERFAALAQMCGAHGGLWNAQAEAYLLAHWPSMGD